MADASVAALDAAAAHFREHGYVVLDGFLTEDDLRLAQDELRLVFPAAEEYHGSRDPGLRARFAGRASAGADYFPFASVEWSLLGVSLPLAGLAEALLGTSAIRVYELHNWAKYTGAADYEQELHRDYGNHTVVVPVGDWARGAVEMFVYVHDVPESHGPTHVVSQLRTASLPPSLLHVTRDAYPEVYASEVSAAGPAGTVLAYRTDIFHRGTAMTAPGGARFALKVSYRIAGDAWDTWIDRLSGTGRIGVADDWHDFVAKATPRQLELLGFPPRGHRYWTTETWLAVCQRYPAADLSAFQPASD
ncbi:MAG TPA: phytanoyl-CoA dioxygenase family protein [Trebonia sp.]|nr:phytanoyl-CoA dioxygenase family protein [Trebonia sp.]